MWNSGYCAFPRKFLRDAITSGAWEWGKVEHSPFNFFFFPLVHVAWIPDDVIPVLLSGLAKRKSASHSTRPRYLSIHLLTLGNEKKGEKHISSSSGARSGGIIPQSLPPYLLEPMKTWEEER